MKTMKYAPVVSYDSETEKWGIFSHDEKRMIALCDSKADAQDVCRIFRESVVCDIDESYNGKNL